MVVIVIILLLQLTKIVFISSIIYNIHAPIHQEVILHQPPKHPFDPEVQAHILVLQ